MEIELTLYEMEMAATVGLKRRADSIAKKRKGHKRGSWSKDIEGACAEYVVAKALDKCWNGSVNTFKEIADVGDIEVRHTELTDGSLIIRTGDDPEAVYVLVTGACPTFKIRGWIKAKDGMDRKYMKNPGNAGVAFFVPFDMLNKIEDLK